MILLVFVWFRGCAAFGYGFSVSLPPVYFHFKLGLFLCVIVWVWILLVGFGWGDLWGCLCSYRVCFDVDCLVSVCFDF